MARSKARTTTAACLFGIAAGVLDVSSVSTRGIAFNAAAAVESGCVGNRVWEDTNENGRQDPEESGVASLAVSLYDPSGTVVDTDVTTGGGYYTLCSVLGPHEIRIDVPPGMRVTARDSGTSDFDDSDATPDGRIGVDVIADKNNQRFDIGLAPDPCSSGGSVGPSDDVAFGVWVQPDEVISEGIYGRFNAALVQWTSPTNIVSVIDDARSTGTRIILQFGTQGDWGFDIKTKISEFTVAKWKSTVDTYGQDMTIKCAVENAIADGTIRGVYLIDEPHHQRWSPDGTSNTYITNADLDEMAGHVKSYWPDARTSVRSSARTLMNYGRDPIVWQHLDEVFVMIQYRKWANHGQDRTIEGFMERQMRDVQAQGLDAIGSVQMLIGAPTTDEEFWPPGSGMQPVGKLDVSPIELEQYVEAFLKPRDANGVADPNGTFRVRDVMVFRWDRGGETDWDDQHYDAAIQGLIDWTATQ